MSDSAPEPRRLRLPEPARAFEARARRLEALAEGHSAGDWLQLLARVARGQGAAVREVPAPAARAPGEGPPLSMGSIPRDETWRRMLGVVLEAADAPELPAEARAAIQHLRAADAASLERLATRLLSGAIRRDELAAAPFVGAGLQAWFGALASGLEPLAVESLSGACPVCGAQPVAGLIDGGTRLRYLSCSLCGTEWNLPRLTCVSCGTESGIAYYKLEGDDGAEAEACQSCRGYLKLFDAEKRPGAEAMADDVATLALDLLVAEQGFLRIGASPWLAVAS